MNGLEEYTDYIYRVDVSDKENNVIGTRANIKTYCSGNGNSYCAGTKTCPTCKRNRF